MIHLERLDLKCKALIVGALTIASLNSCKTPTNVDYFQDTKNGSVTRIFTPENTDLKLRAKDKIMIYVSSRDDVLATLFTLSTPSRSQVSRNVVSTGVATGSTGYQTTLPYTINDAGFIEFPVLGQLQIAGMTRQETAAYIQQLLRDGNHVNDAVVTVEYQNLMVAVLGEVKNPGNYFIDRDNYSILDALTSAGDLTINGVRDNVRVMRREGNVERTYFVNLLSADSTFNSPAFYLHQNDIVYVEPNDMVKRQTVNNANNVRSTSFWFSTGSLLLSLAVLLFK